MTHRVPQHRRKQGKILLVCAITFMILGLVPLFGVLAIQGVNSHHAALQAAEQERAYEQWTPAEQKKTLAEARTYNRKLYESGQHAIGSIADGRTGKVDFAAKADKDYWNTLKGVQGVMGTVRVPRIGVTLTIRHGSDEGALANGAGHLYGTSLPVGGKNTHTVITAHRGVPDKELFTRLDEMRKGDVFYLTVAGRTIAYKVVRIINVDPSDTSHVRIQKNRDLATLLTCTPYGINTQRLLVTGERAAMPKVAPYVENAPKDNKPIWVGIAISACIILVGLILIPARPTLIGGHISRRS